jgi:hypothetical protein
MKTRRKFRVSANHRDGITWNVKVFNNNHNHESTEAASALPQHRIAAMSEEERLLVGSMHQNGHSPLQNAQRFAIVKPGLDELAG